MSAADPKMLGMCIDAGRDGEGLLQLFGSVYRVRLALDPEGTDSDSGFEQT